MNGAEYYNVYYAQRKLEGQLLSERGSRAQNMAAAGIVLKVLLPVSVAHRGTHKTCMRLCSFLILLRHISLDKYQLPDYERLQHRSQYHPEC